MVRYLIEDEKADVYMEGLFSNDEVSRLKLVFEDIMNSPEVKIAYIHMSTLQGINSAGIGQILYLAKELKKRKCIVEIHGVSDNMFHQFERINLIKLVKVIR